MFAYAKVAAAAAIVLAGVVGVAAAPSSPAQPVTRATNAPSRWPSYWSSACSSPVPGTESCHAVRLLTPGTYWSPGPRGNSAARPNRGGSEPSQAPAPPTSGYFPADFQSAYGLTAAAGAMSPGAGAPTVAIVDAYDDPNAASDLTSYRTAMSGATDPNTGLSDPTLPPLCSAAVTTGCVTFTKVNQSGGTSYPSANSGWSEEISLDLDTISAVCPDCNIVLVEATSPTLANLAAAVTEAKAFKPVVITNSYGGSESSSETSMNSAYSASTTTAITAATGDDGYGVEYPAAAPGVTAVGGTSLSYTGSGAGLAWQAQTAWSDSGSGCSADEAIPSWQQDQGVYSVAGTCATRQVADLSADANPATGFATYDTYGEGGWLVFGGTSLSTQVIGATYAVASTTGTLRASASALYPDTGTSSTGPTPGLVPVTSGSNGSCGSTYLCNAADHLSSGYNGPTGLGTPYGVSALASSTIPPTTTTTTSTSTSTTSTSTTEPTTTTSTSTTRPTTTSTSTSTTSTTSTSTTRPTTTSTAPTGPTMVVTVTAGGLSSAGRTHEVPLTVSATNSTSGAGVGAASTTIDVYQGSSCSGSVAASGTFTTGSNGQLEVNFSTRTATTWCALAIVSATGYTTAQGQTTFNT